VGVLTLEAMLSEHNERCRLLTSHGAVLFYLANNPAATMVTTAREVGITERRTHDIIADLKKQGLIEVARKGRRNWYSVRAPIPQFGCKHNAAAHLLLDLVEVDSHAD
jgi:DNA-binding MarR family transcriptional regulator